MIKKILFGFIFFIFLIGNVYANVNIKIDVKPSFSLGETLKFDYTFTSDSDEKISFVPKITCIKGYENFLEIKTLDLKKDVPVKESYEGIEVTKDAEPQQCIASINIKDPFIKTKQEVFEIDTSPTILLDIKLCKDSLCKEKSKSFIRYSNVYLGYDSDIENPDISAKLIYPDKTSKQISLPSSIKVFQTGIYEIEVSASKENYKTVVKKEQFGVIVKEAKIMSFSECNGDSICSYNENHENCPQDCAIGEEGLRTYNAKGVTIFILIFILIALVLVIYSLYLNRKKHPIRRKRKISKK